VLLGIRFSAPSAHRRRIVLFRSAAQKSKKVPRAQIIARRRTPLRAMIDAVPPKENRNPMGLRNCEFFYQSSVCEGTHKTAHR
jgi:hypothetical protein